MKYSVIIPTLNSRDDLDTLFDSIEKNNIQGMSELVFVDAGSKDGTIDIINRYKEKYNYLKLIECGMVSKGKGRNLGVKAATGDVIIHTDSDVEFLPGWFEAIQDSMGYADIVAGFSPDPEGKHLPRVPIYVDGQDITYPTCNIAYKKEVFERVGLYNEVQNMPEDCEFHYRCVKAGYIIHYNPDMKLHHHQRSGRIGFAKQAFWNGEARYELNKLYPELKHSHQHGASFKNLLRLGFGFGGFVIGRFMNKKGEKVD